MKKIRVISEFYDKFHTSTLFRVGTVLEFDDARADDVVARNLAVPVEETAEEKPLETTLETPEVETEEVAEENPAETAEEVAEEAVEVTEETAEVAEDKPKKVGRPKKNQ